MERIRQREANDWKGPYQWNVVIKKDVRYLLKRMEELSGALRNTTHTCSPSAKFLAEEALKERDE